MAVLRTHTGRLVAVAVTLFACAVGGAVGRQAARPAAQITPAQEVPAAADPVAPVGATSPVTVQAPSHDPHAAATPGARASAVTPSRPASPGRRAETLSHDDVLRLLHVTRLSPTDELMLSRLEERGRLGLLLVPR